MASIKHRAMQFSPPSRHKESDRDHVAQQEVA
jgi:hypothetical protein